MPDIFDKEKRSEIMSHVHSKGNKSTEMCLITLFKQSGITGWRRNYPVKGHPDFVFPRERVAVFVDGCFWHGHDCRKSWPKENEEFWLKKREYNKRHDAEITALFESRGWEVLRIWECELKKKNQPYTLYRIKTALHIEKIEFESD